LTDFTNELSSLLFSIIFIGLIAAENILEDRNNKPNIISYSNQLNLNQNEALTNVLINKKKKNDERHELIIQKICEESEELRELQRKLKIAYMNKERAVQQTEKTKLIEMEEAREKAMNDQMEYDRQRALIDEKNQELIKRAKAIESKQIIQNQMLSQLKIKKEAEEEAEKDKKEIQEMILKIENEDKNDLIKRQKLIQNTRNIIADSIKQRQNELEKRKLDEENELKKNIII